MSRAYRSADAEALWELKQGFERGLGEETGSQEKTEQYRDKLDEAYRADYLEWVDRCVAEQPRSVQVAVRDGTVIGYVFVLPESLAYIWDAAVLNEIFVHPDYRGTGVGDELMEAAISLGREQDLPLDRMVLDVDRANRRAQAFYERYGFTYWGEMQSREL
jgi:ribosomal protein S18 acetylase RimI-like enzyme